MKVNSQCPVTGNTAGFTKGRMSNRDWWPNQLDLSVLHQNSNLSNPMGECFNYIEEFKTLDLQALKNDLIDLMHNSHEWWPADYGHYGPFFIRMAWHSAGTYRTMDGRGGAKGGTQRFAPLNSWPDNVNLDKARRLLWPVKKKYGRKISWADLIILAGNCAIESMGLKLIGFAGGRADVWEPQEDINWGEETTWLGDDKRILGDRQLENPLAAVQMGLIYVNPEGPSGNPIPLESAHDVRETFARMAMNDEETVALVAGGHTFGKTHGAAPPTHLGSAPEAAPIEEQGLGWKNDFGTGNAQYTIGSGIEGAWKPNPTTWDMGYLKVLLKYEWQLTKSPAGAHMWHPINCEEEDMVADAHIPGLYHSPMMTTADLSLKYDPTYAKIAKHYHENPDIFADSFAKAWFKLTHRDMGPTSLYFGEDVPTEKFLWQDPIPENKLYNLSDYDIEELRYVVSRAGLTTAQLIKTAWASASTFRGSDKRGGANGARITLQPQISWRVNEPEQLKEVLGVYEQILQDFYLRGKYVSMADLIVLGGAVGIERASDNAICVPITMGRADAFQEETDVDGMAVLEPLHDAFRNYLSPNLCTSPEALLIDKAQLLTLTAPEMTVLLGGLRVLLNNFENTPLGVLTNSPGRLTNDFFVNLLDMETKWIPTEDKNKFAGINTKTGEQLWTTSRVDLIFGSNAQLRAIAEVYASDDAKDKFLNDFVCAWNKVMNADRFDPVRMA